MKKKKKKKKERRRKEGVEVGYKRYLFMVLKHVHPGMGVSSKAVKVVNGMMNDIFERLAEEGKRLCQHTNRMTMTSRKIQGAVRLLLPGELGKHAIAEGTKAVINYVIHNHPASS